MDAEQMSAKEFAEQVGISQATMSNILGGRNKPSLEVFQKVLERFRTVSSDWLILGVGTMRRQINDSQGDKSAPSTGVQPSKSAAPELVFPDSNPSEKIAAPEIHRTSMAQQSAEKAADHTGRRIRRIVIYYEDGTYEER